MTQISASRIADELREQLVQSRFADDGKRLRGPVIWRHPELGDVEATVDVELDDLFPFAQPRVRLVDPGCDIELTFHINPPSRADNTDTLCLWEDRWPVDHAPWTTVEGLLDRIAGWLRETALDWPDDEVCDLERYLNQDKDTLVLYERQRLAHSVGEVVRTTGGPNDTVVVTDKRRTVRHRPGKRDTRLAWVADLGAITRPVRTWEDIVAIVGEPTREMQRLISCRVVSFVILRYRRGTQDALLALKVAAKGGHVELAACESADASDTTRQLRAGPLAEKLAEVRVAVVGCGAVGSFATDTLYRSGVRKFTLIDHERLRPGNLVRHLASERHIGAWKVSAVRCRLADLGMDVRAVSAQARSLGTLHDAADVVDAHDVVLDATASARASSLLATAASLADRTVISACVQRDGEVVRVDRFPLAADERHLQPLPDVDDDHRPRESGCGNPVSLTPPGAVIAAAELAGRMVIDAAVGANELPVSLVDVRRPQPAPPYDRLGLHTPGDGQ